MKYELIVFDWDGTLADSKARIVAAMQSAIADTGYESRTQHQIEDIIGLGLLEAIEKLYPDPITLDTEHLADRYREAYVALNKEPCRLFPDVRETLERLKEADYRLAIATGKSRKGLDRALSETELGEFFTDTRCVDESVSKPDPRMLQELMQSTGIGHRTTLMVGDTEYDLMMANQAKVASIGVSYGAHSSDRLLRHQPITCIDHMSELLEILT